MKAIQKATKFFYIFCLGIMTACGAPKEQVAATMAVQTMEARGTGTAAVEQAVSNALTQAAPTFTPTNTPIPTLTTTPTTTPALEEFSEILPTENSTSSEEFSDTDPSGNAIPMRLVPAGEFTMGSDDADEAMVECQKYSKHCEYANFAASGPPHQIEVDAFYMDQYEVTNALYKACVDAKVCVHPTQYDSGYSRKEYYEEPEFDNYPVIYVKWELASAYCEWRGARLPTEAEWEKAARGTDERTYPWGEGIDCSKANYPDNNQQNFCVGDTTEVGSYKRDISPYGIYDMAGNVSEWVDDWYVAYPGNTIKDSHYGATFRVVRGGSWYSGGGWQGLPGREYGLPDSSNFATGFRCIRYQAHKNP